MENIKAIGRRPDIPRTNISKKALFNLGLDVHSLMDLHALFLHSIEPDFIEETFIEKSLGVRWTFKINMLKAKLGKATKYTFEERSYKPSVLYLPETIASVDSKLETDGLIYDNMRNLLSSAFDASYGMAPFHFVYGKGKKAVEYFIGPKDSESGDSYNENITRDL